MDTSNDKETSAQSANTDISMNVVFDVNSSRNINTVPNSESHTQIRTEESGQFWKGLEQIIKDFQIPRSSGEIVCCGEHWEPVEKQMGPCMENGNDKSKNTDECDVDFWKELVEKVKRYHTQRESGNTDRVACLQFWKETTEHIEYHFKHVRANGTDTCKGLPDPNSHNETIVQYDPDGNTSRQCSGPDEEHTWREFIDKKTRNLEELKKRYNEITENYIRTREYHIKKLLDIGNRLNDNVDPKCCSIDFQEIEERCKISCDCSTPTCGSNISTGSSTCMDMSEALSLSVNAECAPVPQCGSCLSRGSDTSVGLKKVVDDEASILSEKDQLCKGAEFMMEQMKDIATTPGSSLSRTSHTNLGLKKVSDSEASTLSEGDQYCMFTEFMMERMKELLNKRDEIMKNIVVQENQRERATQAEHSEET